MVKPKRRDGSFLILFKDDSKKEVFMVFRTDYPLWVLTGGGIEPGETPKEAALREAVEESGFKCRLIKYIGKYEHWNKDVFLFEGRYVSGTYKPEFKGNIGKWFPVDSLPLDISSFTKRRILDAIAPHDKPFIVKIKNDSPFITNFGFMCRHPIGFLKYLEVKRKNND
jgi:8-oxo-dGTP diphosphatase